MFIGFELKAWLILNKPENQDVYVSGKTTINQSFVPVPNRILV